MKKLFVVILLIIVATCQWSWLEYVSTPAFATVTSSTNKNDYVGNGTASTYSYTFRIFDEDNLVLTVADTDDVETELTITTDYTVTGVGAASGGTVVLVDSSQDWLDGDGDLLTDYKLNIRRVRPLTQETDIRNQGTFFPEIHEDTFDQLLMVSQQLQEESDRSVTVPVTSDAIPVLPTPVDGTVNVWSGTGGAMVTAAYSTVNLNAAVAEAETAQTAAELAQTNAETAETNAETAETNAETAETGAEDAQAAAEAAVAQINAEIHDDDDDTKVETEQTADADEIVFTAAGEAELTISTSGLSFYSGAVVNEISIDGTFAGNSDTALITEKAAKTYADGLITSGSQTFSVSDPSWDVPNGVDTLFVTLVGGGAGGGTSSANGEGSGGGGAGAFYENFPYAVTSAQEIAIVIGTGGAGGAAGGSDVDGADGVDSTFDGVLTAPKGLGGKSHTNGFNGGAGGAGATSYNASASVATASITGSSAPWQGGNGAKGVDDATADGGGGGATPFGDGGDGTTGPGIGSDGTGYGSGGGGGVGASKGGDGQDGICIVRW